MGIYKRDGESNKIVFQKGNHIMAYNIVLSHKVDRGYIQITVIRPLTLVFFYYKFLVKNINK